MAKIILTTGAVVFTVCYVLASLFGTVGAVISANLHSF